MITTVKPPTTKLATVIQTTVQHKTNKDPNVQPTISEATTKQTTVKATTTADLQCLDVEPCSEYGPEVCQYGDWAKDNCGKYCKFC